MYEKNIITTISTSAHLSFHADAVSLSSISLSLSLSLSLPSTCSSFCMPISKGSTISDLSGAVQSQSYRMDVLRGPMQILVWSHRLLLYIRFPWPIWLVMSPFLSLFFLMRSFPVTLTVGMNLPHSIIRFTLLIRFLLG